MEGDVDAVVDVVTFLEHAVEECIEDAVVVLPHMPLTNDIV